MLPKLLKSLSSWPTTLTVSLLILVGATAVKLWPRTVPFSQCSEVYQKYAGNPDIDASFIKDFRINDSVFVDVTLLEATDSAGWGILCNDFKIPVLDSASQSDIDNGMDLVFTKKLDGNDYTKPITDTTSEIVVRSFSYLKKSVCIFHTKNKAEEHAVLFYNFDYSAKQ